MAILLASADETVLRRWQELLAGTEELRLANNLLLLRSLIGDPDVRLTLLHRPLVDLEAVKSIRGDFPDMNFFLLSDRPDEEEGLIFLQLGVVGYTNTYISANRLLEAVKVIEAGSVWIGQKIMQRLIKATLVTTREVTSSDAGERLGRLTPREYEISELIALGQSNLEIAANLNISERTVKAHLSSIYRKTRTGSRLALALLVNQQRQQESPYPASMPVQ